MTTTTEGIALAVERANAEFNPKANAGSGGLFIAATLMASLRGRAAAQLATELLAEREAHEATAVESRSMCEQAITLDAKFAELKAKLAASAADWARIDEIAEFQLWGRTTGLGGGNLLKEVATIAARHRPESEVDPLIIEARELLALEAPGTIFAKRCIQGEHDGCTQMEIIVLALKRGLELAKRGVIIPAGGVK